ncbi:MAG: pyridoxal 5'-phosphate synthase glutaminase subunit PdxT [Lentisphaeria bacterium]
MSRNQATNERRRPESARIGIVDLQGGVVEHLDHLDRIGVEAVRIKKPADLSDDLVGIILPGGESTCLSRLFKTSGLDNEIRRLFSAKQIKIWGTCAGAILVANRVVSEEAKLPFIDLEVERNAFGSQLESFRTAVSIPEVAAEELPLTFIRAPKILSAGPDVHVLLRQRGYIAMAENENVLVTVFHPELTPCLQFHRYFAKKCGLTPLPDKNAPTTHPWSPTSWTRHVRV